MTNGRNGQYLRTGFNLKVLQNNLLGKVIKLIKMSNQISAITTEVKHAKFWKANNVWSLEFYVLLRFYLTASTGELSEYALLQRAAAYDGCI